MKEILIFVTKDPLKKTLPFEMKPKDYGYKVEFVRVQVFRLILYKLC